MASDGLIALDEKKNPVPFYEALLRNPIADSKYAVMPDPAREEPIFVSKSLYLGFIRAIAELGALKDEGEKIEGVAHAFLFAKLASSLEEPEGRALKILGLDPSSQERIHEEAKRLFAELREHGLVEAMRREVREGGFVDRPMRVENR